MSSNIINAIKELIGNNKYMDIQLYFGSYESYGGSMSLKNPFDFNLKRGIYKHLTQTYSPQNIVFYQYFDKILSIDTTTKKKTVTQEKNITSQLTPNFAIKAFETLEISEELFPILKTYHHSGQYKLHNYIYDNNIYITFIEENKDNTYLRISFKYSDINLESLQKVIDFILSQH